MQTVSFAGSNYNIPNTRGDRPWSGLSDFVIAAASKAINTAGGSFTLLADINFGATFGLVSTYYKSRTANVATAGQLRLASADVISWRNNANGANIDLSKDTSDNLKYNATKVLLSGAVVNADINAAAAIAYSKLNLATSIVNADISASAAIVYSKLSLTGSIVNADLTAGTITNTAINASAAIAYSKLALTGSILNADVNASAAIAHSKMAALTISRALVSDGSGIVAAATTTSTEIGYVNGVTSAIQTQLDAKAKTDLSNVASVSANVPMNSHKFTGLSAGAASGESVRFEQILGFRVLQVVAGTTSVSAGSTSTSFADTNLTATITPSLATSTILVVVNQICSIGAGTSCSLKIVRTSTTVYGPIVGLFANTTTLMYSLVPMMYLDSPATTSATTYKTQFARSDGASTCQVQGGGLGNTTQSQIFLIELG